MGAFSQRRLTDPHQLRALAHPTRLSLLTEVGLRGTLTATQAAEIVGGTPAASAYHLRALGRHGFIEEAEGGDGRERPWKLSHVGFSWNEQSEDPAEQTVARALGDVMREDWLRHIRNYYENADRYPADVRAVSAAGEIILFATRDELEDVQRKIAALLEPFKDRIADSTLRPPGFPPFEMIVFAHPLMPPDGSGESATP